MAQAVRKAKAAKANKLTQAKKKTEGPQVPKPASIHLEDYQKYSRQTLNAKSLFTVDVFDSKQMEEIIGIIMPYMEERQAQTNPIIVTDQGEVVRKPKKPEINFKKDDQYFITSLENVVIISVQFDGKWKTIITQNTYRSRLKFEGNFKETMTWLKKSL